MPVERCLSIGRVILWVALAGLLGAAIGLDGCKRRSPTHSSGGGDGGGGGDAFCENCGYGITGAVADFREIAKYVRWTVIDLSSGDAAPRPTAQIVAAVQSAKAAGLKVLFVPINLNCQDQNCPPDPVDLTRQVAAVGTANVWLEVSEPQPSHAAIVTAIHAAWPGQIFITEGPYMPPGPVDRHECDPDPNTWPARPMHMTDCHPSLTQNARAIGEWLRARPGTAGILYDLRAQAINRTVLEDLAGR